MNLAMGRVSFIGSGADLRNPFCPISTPSTGPVSAFGSAFGSASAFSLSNSSSPRVHAIRRGSGVVSFAVSSVEKEAAAIPETGLVFLPFEEVKRDEFIVPVSPNTSLARQKYSGKCESAINEQINVEYNVSYVYHSLFSYFDRDNIALNGFAKFFKESSEEEREHAEKLMEYQNKRGGRVKLYSIIMPPTEFEHVEKGDALYAMELSLSLEKLVNEKLLKLHEAASAHKDAQMTEFIEREFLSEQVESIKKISEYVTQLRLVGKGHGLWHFDQKLLHKDGL